MAQQSSTPAETPERRAFYDRISQKVLFSFSDRPVQEALQLFREERRDA
jgi:gentisate 1,2-dioxygenase